MGKETIPAKARRTAEITPFHAAVDSHRQFEVLAFRSLEAVRSQHQGWPHK